MYSIRATYLPCENMHFDQEYYCSEHVELAKKLLAGKVDYLKMELEFDMALLCEKETIISPCIFVLYVDGNKEVEDFINFRKSDSAKLLKDDMPNYTNCQAQWSIAKVVKAQFNLSN